MIDHLIPLRSLCVGYLRRLDGVDDKEEARLVAEMATFADREGFTLAMMFVEKAPGHTAALHSMTGFCQHLGIRNVVVPTSSHLNTLPSLAYLAGELLQEDIGGQVWIVATTGGDDLPCPLTTKDGGTT